jgi:hypothetical protein
MELGELKHCINPQVKTQMKRKPSAASYAAKQKAAAIEAAAQNSSEDHLGQQSISLLTDKCGDV